MKSKSVLCMSIVSLFGVAGCFGPSSEELKEAQSQCAKFYKEKRAKYNDYVTTVDHWNKNGKLVIELAVKSYSDSSSYTSGLCLYDKERGTIEIPGMFDQQRWYK